MTTTTPDHELGALFAAARAAARIEMLQANLVDEPIAGVQRRVIPDGLRVEAEDLEKYLPRPRRATGTTVLARTDSFITWVNRLAGDDTVVYVDTDRPTIIAVLNDHTSLESHAAPVAGWGDLRAVLAWRPSLLWSLWRKHHGTWLEQEAFAELIEEGASAVLAPDAATLLEIATTFKAQKSSEIAIARRQQSGEVRFEWNETIDARAGRGDEHIEIPDRFTLQLTPFDGATPVTVQARLRYRVEGRQLRLGYLLDRPDQIVRDAVEAECTLLAERLHPAVTVVHGNRP